jgi:hypothetical protein
MIRIKVCFCFGENVMPNTQDSLLDDVDQIPDMDTITASLLFLLSKPGAESDSSVSKAIVDHLLLLEKHPSCKTGVLNNTARKLRCYWNELRSEKQQQATESLIASDLASTDFLH